MPKHYSAELFPLSKEIKVLIAMILGTIIIGSIGYALILKITPWQGFIQTIETLAFISEYEYTGLAKALHLIILLFGVIIIWFALWSSFDLMIQGQFKKYFSGVRMMDKIKKMSNHYIICGGGRVGEHIAEILAKKKKKFVIVERENELRDEIVREGYPLVKGDALDEETLLDAGAKKAVAVISVLPETEKNILVTLTARELNPSVKIYARADKKEYVKKLHKAGADFVSLPEVSCAEEIGSKIE